MKVEDKVRRALREEAARLLPSDRWDQINTGQLRQTELNFERGPTRTRRLVVVGLALALTTASIVVVARAFDRSSTSIPGGVPRESMIAFAVTGPPSDAGQALAQDIDAVVPDGSGLRNLTPDDAEYFSPAWSPDGTELAYVRFERNGGSFNEGIFIANADNTEATKIYDSGLPTPISLSHLAWSPDGTKIGFVQTKWVEGSDADAVMQLRVMNADGTGVTVLGGGSASNGGQIASFSWSPDGNEIAFTRQVSQGNQFASDLFVMDADGNDVRQLTDDGSSMNPSWSPDGSLIAFEVPSDNYHHRAIYVINVGDGHRTQLTSGPLDDDPVWSPDGSQIAFIRVDGDSNIAFGVRRSSLMIMNADGTDQHAIVTTDEANGSPTTPSWQAAAPSPASSILRVTCPPEGPPQVATPTVASQADGLHVVIDNQADASAVIFRQPSRPQVAWSSGSNGLDNEFSLPVPPGETFLSCFTSGAAPSPAPSPGAPMQPNEAAFKLVDYGSWTNSDLSCGFDEHWAFGANAVSGDFSTPAEAVRAAAPGILPTDTVEDAGYPDSAADEPLVRVVREGRVVAWARATQTAGGWNIDGYACPNSGIGRSP